MLSVRVSSKVEDLRAQIQGLSQDFEAATNDNHTIVTKIDIFLNKLDTLKNLQMQTNIDEPPTKPPPNIT